MNISDLQHGDEVYVRAKVIAIDGAKKSVWVTTPGDDMLILIESDLAPVQPVDVAHMMAEQKAKEQADA